MKKQKGVRVRMCVRVCVCLNCMRSEGCMWCDVRSEGCMWCDVRRLLAISSFASVCQTSMAVRWWAAVVTEERMTPTAGCVTREGRCSAVTSAHESSTSAAPNWTRSPRGRSGTALFAR